MNRYYKNSGQQKKKVENTKRNTNITDMATKSQTPIN